MDGLFDVLPLNEMKNVIDLISLYHEVNIKVIAEKQNDQHIFKKFTLVITEIVKLLKGIKIELEDKEYDFMKTVVPDTFKSIGIKDVSVWMYFDIQNKLDTSQTNQNSAVRMSNPSSNNQFYKVPTIKTDRETMKMLESLQSRINDFSNLVENSGKSRN